MMAAELSAETGDVCPGFHSFLFKHGYWMLLDVTGCYWMLLVMSPQHHDGINDVHCNERIVKLVVTQHLKFQSPIRRGGSESQNADIHRSVQFIARTAEVRGSLLVLTRWFN